jgi:hypothetical protein
VQAGLEEYLASWHEHRISFHVYNMMDDVHASSLSKGHYERSAAEFANAPVGPPVFHGGRYSVNTRDLGYNFLRGRIAIVGSRMLCFPGLYFAPISGRPAQRSLTERLNLARRAQDERSE